MSSQSESQGTPARRADTTGAHRRHLRNYLIDRSLQLRYIVVVLLVSALIAGTLGALLSWQERAATDLVVKQAGASDFVDPELEAFIATEKRSEDRSQLFIMLGIGAGLAVVLTSYLLVTTHKVAGPLFKVSAYFDRMTAGKLPRVYKLRKGDQLRSFFERFKAMDEALRVRAEDEIRVLEKVLAAGDGQPELAPQLEALRARLAAKKASLD